MEKRSLQRHLEQMNRKYFSKKYRLTMEHDSITKSTGDATCKMGGENVLLNEHLQEARNEILRLKYALASHKTSKEAKEEVNKLKEELYLAKGEIRELYHSLDAKRPTVSDLWSELIRAKRTIVDLSGALHKDRSTLTKL